MVNDSIVCTKKRICLAYKTKRTMLWKDLQSKVIKQYSFFPSLCSLPPPSVLAFLGWWVFFLLLQSLFNLFQESYFREPRETKQQSCVCSQTMQLLTSLSEMKANQARNSTSLGISGVLNLSLAVTSNCQQENFFLLQIF